MNSCLCRWWKTIIRVPECRLHLSLLLPMKPNTAKVHRGGDTGVKQMHCGGDVFYKYSLCVLILYILPFVCTVLVCLWPPLKWLYQSNLVTCQLPWNWLIHQKCDASRLFSILEMPYLCQIIQTMILYIWSHLLICDENFIKVIVPVANASSSLPLPSQAESKWYGCSLMLKKPNFRFRAPKNQADIKQLGAEGPRLCVADGSPKKEQRLQLTDKKRKLKTLIKPHFSLSQIWPTLIENIW